MSIRCTSVRMISRFVAGSRLQTPAQPLLQAHEAELLLVESVPADRRRRIPFKLASEIRDSSFCPSHPRRELVFSIKPWVKRSISLSIACYSLVLCDLRLSRLSDKVSVVPRVPETIKCAIESSLAVGWVGWISA
jgi:hypothetical protein